MHARMTSECDFQTIRIDIEYHLGGVTGGRTWRLCNSQPASPARRRPVRMRMPLLLLLPPLLLLDRVEVIATPRTNHSVPRNHSDSAGGLNVTFHFRAVGFAPDTLVRVRDLFAHVDLGVFTEQYTVEVPLHGAQMLHLAYEPKFHGSHTEL